MAIILIRTLIIFASLLAAMRLLGKRQLGEMELSELVVAVLAADVLVNPLQDTGMPLLYGLVPLVALFCCELLISGATLRSVRLRQLLFGRPSTLIEKGHIAQREMARNRFTLDELTQELRNQGILDISTVEYAVLETNGQLNVVLYPTERPATAGQLKLSPADDGYFSIIVSDGRVLSENLERMGRDRRWLAGELRRRKAAGPQDVYLLMLSDAGQVYYAAKERRA